LVLSSCRAAPEPGEKEAVEGKVTEKEAAKVEEKPAPVVKEEPKKEPAEPTGPQYGGHLRAAIVMTLSSLEPILCWAGGDTQVWRQMYDSIITSDEMLVPQEALSLAESWEFPTPTTMLFHLRKGIKFHDGTPFNAEAVKLNIERVLDPEVASPQRSAAKVIQRVEVVDDYTVKFHLETPWGAGLGALADRIGTMNSPTAVKKFGEESRWNPTGTGPFKLDEYLSDSYIIMVRNKEYWREIDGNRLPYLDKLTITIIGDEAVRSAALETGELEAGPIPPKDIKKFEANPDITPIAAPPNIGSQIWFNWDIPPFDNKYLRKAFAFALNPEEVNLAVFFGTAEVAKGGNWVPECWVYMDEPLHPYYDTEKVKEFLKLGGAPDGYKVTAVSTNNPTTMRAVEMYQAQLAKVGIELKLDVYDDKGMCDSYWVQKKYAAMISSSSRYPEPDRAASRYFAEGATQVPNNANLPEWVKETQKEAASLYDIEERKKLYKKLQEWSMDNIHIVPFLWGTGYWGYWHDRVGGADTLFNWDAKPKFAEMWMK